MTNEKKPPLCTGCGNGLGEYHMLRDGLCGDCLEKDRDRLAERVKKLEWQIGEAHGNWHDCRDKLKKIETMCNALPNEADERKHAALVGRIQWKIADVDAAPPVAKYIFALEHEKTMLEADVAMARSDVAEMEAVLDRYGLDYHQI